MERLAEIDIAVFDKTGTLTLGRPKLANRTTSHSGDLSPAAKRSGPRQFALTPSLSALAIAETCRRGGSARVSTASPNCPAWVSEALQGESVPASRPRRMGLGRGRCLSRRSGPPCLSRDRRAGLLPSASRTAPARRRGCGHRGAGEGRHRKRDRLRRPPGRGGPRWRAPARHRAFCRRHAPRPEDRSACRNSAGQGRKALKWSATASTTRRPLAAAHVSMAPANAADIGRQAGRPRLPARGPFCRAGGDRPVAAGGPGSSARTSPSATVYNFIRRAPVAVLGYVTPLGGGDRHCPVSSVIVVLNAMRLRPSRVHAIARGAAPEEVRRGAGCGLEACRYEQSPLS